MTLEADGCMNKVSGKDLKGIYTQVDEGIICYLMKVNKFVGTLLIKRIDVYLR